jgi:hypothetical protein
MGLWGKKLVEYLQLTFYASVFDFGQTFRGLRFFLLLETLAKVGCLKISGVTNWQIVLAPLPLRPEL